VRIGLQPEGLAEGVVGLVELAEPDGDGPLVRPLPEVGRGSGMQQEQESERALRMREWDFATGPATARGSKYAVGSTRTLQARLSKVTYRLAIHGVGLCCCVHKSRDRFCVMMLVKGLVCEAFGWFALILMFGGCWMLFAFGFVGPMTDTLPIRMQMEYTE
jgi:hypothetical protein